MKLQLRDYQLEAKSAIYEAWEQFQRVGCVLPTGSGKTVIFADMAAEMLSKGHRVLILVHRDELVRQTISKLHAVIPAEHIGRIQGKYNDVQDVTVASVQTLSRNPRLGKYGPGLFDRIIVDEAHHAVAESYMRILWHFGGLSVVRTTRVVGFTATMTRADKLGLGDVWQNIAYKKDILWMIKNGYLVDIRGKSIAVGDLDLTGIKTRGGDYSDGDLGNALIDSSVMDVAARAYLEHGQGQPFVAFLPTVASATEAHTVFTRYGITCDVITGSTPLEDRQLAYKRVSAGESQGLINCMVLTEGFDLPALAVALIIRPTQSQSLYIQMVGRILRLWVNKSYGLVLDFVGASEDHRLASRADLSETRIPLKDDESLTEGADRLENEEDDTQNGGLTGSSGKAGKTYTSADVDLFKASSSAWLKSHRGYWFIPTTDWTVVCYPEDSSEATFMVGALYTGYGQRKPGTRIVDGVPLNYAMAWAESWAEDTDASISKKTSSWRKGKVAATTAQKRFADSLGIEYPDDILKGVLSDQISIEVSSRRIDGYRPKPAPREDESE